MELCLAIQGSSFYSDTEAENALDKILSVVSLAKNFSLVPCDNINNAFATSYKGERFILYDKAFMKKINLRTNDWSNLTILAHEVGHHLNNHAVDLALYKMVEPKTLAKKRKQELEADEFSGFIMAKLGASLNQVKDAIALISSDKDDTYSTHPSKSKRMIALTNGWKRGETEKNITDKKYEKNEIRNFENKAEIKNYWNESYDKYGYWFRTQKKDILKNYIEWTSHSYGQIIGNSQYFNQAPVLTINHKYQVYIESNFLKEFLHNRKKLTKKVVQTHFYKGVEKKKYGSPFAKFGSVDLKIILIDSDDNHLFSEEYRAYPPNIISKEKLFITDKINQELLNETDKILILYGKYYPPFISGREVFVTKDYLEIEEIGSNSFFEYKVGEDSLKSFSEEFVTPNMFDKMINFLFYN